MDVRANTHRIAERRVNGVNTKFAVPDAGYCTVVNSDALACARGKYSSLLQPACVCQIHTLSVRQTGRQTCICLSLQGYDHAAVFIVSQNSYGCARGGEKKQLIKTAAAVPLGMFTAGRFNAPPLQIYFRLLHVLYCPLLILFRTIISGLITKV